MDLKVAKRFMDELLVSLFKKGEDGRDCVKALFFTDRLGSSVKKIGKLKSK